MAWDFSTDDEFETKLTWVRAFVREEVAPLDVLFPGCEYLPLDDERRKIVDPLKQRVRDEGLWAPHLGPELGGQGFGAVKLTLLNEILGRTDWGPIVFGTQAPDTGNAEIIARFGTPEQKERYLAPLLAGEIFSCFSMTEPQGGADPRVFTTRARREGDEWVIDGRKYWSSNAAVASFLIIVAITNPDVPVHHGASTFLVPRDTSRVVIEDSHHVFGAHHHEPGHSLVRYEGVRVPADALLGQEGRGFEVAQSRLAGGRLHHAMRAIGVAQRAIDDGTARQKPLHPGQLTGRQAVRAGVHRRVLHRADAVPPRRAARRLAHRHPGRACRPHRDRGPEGAHPEGHPVDRAAGDPGPRRARHHRAASAGRHVHHGARSRPRRRAHRGAQGNLARQLLRDYEAGDPAWPEEFLGRRLAAAREKYGDLVPAVPSVPAGDLTGGRGLTSGLRPRARR